MNKRSLRLILLKTMALVSLKPRSYSSVGDRILLIRPDHLGDVLFTTPALRQLRGAFPQAHIAYMVGPWSQEVIQSNPCIDEVLVCPFPGFSRAPKSSLLAPYKLLWGEARRLRDHAFDSAIILRFDFWWGAALTHLAGIPHRVGYDLKECQPFLSQAIPYSPERHEVEQNLALVNRYADEEFSTPGPLEFITTAADEDFVKQRLSDISTLRPLIAIHPGTGAPVKRWRKEAFAQLADVLAREYGAQILITGSPKEESLVAEVVEAMNIRPLTLTNASLSQLAALLRHCHLVIGVDSGVLHLAVAMGIPTIHLYGPVSAASFGPWGPSERHRVITAEMSCVPCHRLDYREDELEYHPCVTSIPVKRVLDTVQNLLGEVKVAHRH
ncbi:MAG: lipopolysaccharide heptosyltransferase II [Chloroflexi bacterium]|nr:lipopolysaccharide heptosyltransferase II [Chloroflexota bacterium]